MTLTNKQNFKKNYGGTQLFNQPADRIFLPDFNNSIYKNNN